MPAPRLTTLRALAKASDALALGGLWAVCIPLRIALGEAWPLDLVPGVTVLKEVDPDAALRNGFLVVPMFLGVLGWRGRWHALRRSGLELGATATSVGIALVAVQSLLFLAALPGPRTLVVGFALLALPTLLLSQAAQRAALHALRRRQYDPHHTLLVGPDEALADWRRVVAAHPEWGVQVVGHVPPEQVATALLAQPVDEVVVAGLPEQVVAELARSAEEIGVPLSVDARFVGPRSGVHLQELDGLPLLTLGPHQAGLDRVVKSLLDRVGAAVLLGLSAPVLLLAALAVRLADGGPALHVQERVGLHGRRFRLYKLRTMRVGAEREHEALRLAEGHGAPAFKPASDPRVTPVGRWLRRLSIDELPQLVNVLLGEMSLVGPRPPLPDEVARYQRWELRRLSVPPGMTGLWQVSGRADLPWERWVQLDLEYVDRWSLGLDLWLLARTLPAVLRGRGAR